MMSRVDRVVFRLVVVALFLCFGVNRLHAQAQTQPPATPPPAQEAADKDKDKDDDEDENPFAPEPAPTLPPGMTGSDVDDPRAKLTPGMYDAGEASMGIKHLILLKKPDAFQLGASDPDDPKVQKTIGQLGIGNIAKIPKPMHLVIAQLAFANSDFAFQGNHLFQGNFHGVSIYRHLQSREHYAADFAGVPGRAGRPVGVQEFVVHVGGDAEWTPGLRRGRISAGASAPRRGGKR